MENNSSMRVILVINNNESFRYNLPKKYIKKSKGQYILPNNGKFKFYSAGYVYRICEREWNDFKDADTNLVEQILSNL